MRNKLGTALLTTLLVAGWPLQALADATYLPNLGANATGTTVGAKKTLDVSIPAGLAITDPAEGAPGAATPADAILVGGSDGTNLRSMKVDTLGNMSIRALTSGTDSCSAVQSGTWNLNNISGTISLPTGAATAANQTTANTSLSSIDTKTPALVGGRVPVDGSGVTQPVSAASLPLPTGAATEATLSALNTKVTAVNTGAVVVSSSALPTGASTSANQTTGNTSLASIDGKMNSLGQKTMANSMPVTIASDQVAPKTYANSAGSFVLNASLTTVVTETAPAGAVGFILEAKDSNAANIRWAVGATATATSGMQLQPGRDTGYVPVGANLSIVAESGTLEYQLTWVKQ